MIARILFVSAVITSITACGTAHHFIPPTPLAEGDWRIQTTWHFDFDKLQPQPSVILPDVGAYYGLASDVSFGFGVNFIGWPSYASVVRYLPDRGGKYTKQFLHFAPISPTRNPLFEIGLERAVPEGKLFHNFRIALGLGTRPVWPLGPRNSNYSEYTPILMAGYVLQGNDAGLSIRYDHTSSKRSIKQSLAKLLYVNDTIVVFREGQIDSVTFDDKIEFGAHGKCTVHRKDTVEYIFYRPFFGIDQIYAPHRDFDRWHDDEMLTYVIAGQPIVLDLKELKSAADSGSRIVIRRFPKRWLERLASHTSPLNDLRIGATILAYPK